MIKNLCSAFVTLAALFASHTFFAQAVERNYPPVEIGGPSTPNAWAGGLNAVQFSEIDLNLDGKMDLFVFDRIGNMILPFILEEDGGEARYVFSPEYRENFPDLKYWVLLRDYNKDGIMDIFMYSGTPGVSGIEVHKGFIENNRLGFTKLLFPGQTFDLLYYPLNSGGRTNLYVAAFDIPAIDDIDGDGDLDVLTFNVAGGTIELYDNQSIERGFGNDTLIYIKKDDCWGGVFESGVSPELDLADRIGDCAVIRQPGQNSPISLRHTGSTLLSLDLDNDCDKELILGDLAFDHLVLARNGGNCDRAWINSQDTFFPSYDLSVNLASFPASFFLDLDNDGLKDLVATKNFENGGEDYDAVWFYKNVQSNEFPVFEFVQKNFLTEQMIDFGTGAYPVFVDVNADGLLDLVVGNESYYVRGGDKDSRLQLFENQGSATQPRFVLTDNDWLNLKRFTPAGGSSNGIWSFAPAFGDLDQDGDQDLLVGNSDGKLFYLENIAGAGNPFAFTDPSQHFSGIDVGGFSAPAIGDINLDGLPDILVGEQNGNVNYFENTGTPGFPQFGNSVSTAPNQQEFGKIDLRENFGQTGYGTPLLMRFEDRTDLFIGNDEGALRLYKNAENGLTETLTLETNYFGNIFSGRRTAMAMGDIDADELLEMVVGNLRGGLEFFETNLSVRGEIVSNNTIVPESETWKIFPNPASRFLFFEFEKSDNHPRRLNIFNAFGKMVYSDNLTEDAGQVDISGLESGLYFVVVRDGKYNSVKKLIKN